MPLSDEERRTAQKLSKLRTGENAPPGWSRVSVRNWASCRNVARSSSVSGEECPLGSSQSNCAILTAISKIYEVHPVRRVSVDSQGYRRQHRWLEAIQPLILRGERMLEVDTLSKVRQTRIKRDLTSGECDGNLQDPPKEREAEADLIRHHEHSWESVIGQATHRASLIRRRITGV